MSQEDRLRTSEAPSAMRKKTENPIIMGATSR
jgi:hypothetical protein